MTNESKEIVQDAVATTVEETNVSGTDVQPASFGKVLLVTGALGAVMGLGVYGAYKLVEFIGDKVEDIREKRALKKLEKMEVVEDSEIEE